MNGKTRWNGLCDILGVQPNEEFKLHGNDVNDKLTYKIVTDDEGNDGALLVKHIGSGKWVGSALNVNSLLDGETVIVHLPFIPEASEGYYYVHFGLDDNLELVLKVEETDFWVFNDYDKMRLALGNCFRSEQEIYNIYGTLENAFQQIYHRPWSEFLEIYNKQRGVNE